MTEKEHKDVISKFSTRGILFAVLAVLFAGVASFASTGTANADVSPSGCGTNAFALTVSRSPSQAEIGQTITYAVTAGNPSLGGAACDISNVNISFTDPAGAVTTLATGASYPAGSPDAQVGSNITYVAAAADVVSGKWTGHADFTGELHDTPAGTDPQSGSKSVSVTQVTPSTTASISSSKSSLQSGDTVDLTITEANDGDVSLTGAHVVLSRNDGGTDVDLVAPPTSGDTNSDGVLDPGETWSWTVSGVTVTQNPTVFTATGHGTDTLGNDITGGTEVDTVSVSTVSPSTTASISSSKSSVQSGGTVDLTITEANDGDVSLTGAHVVLSRNDGGTDVGLVAPPTSGDTNSDGVLDPGETWSWTVSGVTVTQNPTVFTATGHGTDTLGNDITGGTEVDTVSVSTVSPSTTASISSSKSSVQSGGTVDLTITEANDGDVSLTGAHVVLSRNDGGTDVDLVAPPTSGDINSDGVLDPGETWSWTVSGVTVTQNPTVFTATGHGTDTLGNDITGGNEVDTVSVATGSPSTTASISSSASSVQSGGSVTLTVHEANDGTVSLTNAHVVLSRNDGGADVTLDDTTAGFSGDTNSNGILDPGETWSWSVSGVTVTQNPTVFTATGHGTDTLGNDITGGNEVDTVSVATGSPSTTASISSSASSVQSGGSVTLTVHEANDGTVSLTNAHVVLSRNDGGADVTLDDTTAGFSGDTNSNGILDPGETWSWSVSGVTVTQNPTVFTATGHGTDTLGNDITGGTEVATVSVSVTQAFQGCTPGFWKNHTNLWGSTYTPTTLLTAVFTGVNGSLHTDTLLNALNYGGGNGVVGAQQILLRAAVSALLNAENANVSYPLSAASIISQVNTALASNNRGTILALATTLDGYNNLPCSIDAHGNPI